MDVKDKLLEDLQSDPENYHIAKNYIFKRLLGKGGFCRVYQATRIATNKDYAIKVFDKREEKKGNKGNWTRHEADVLRSMDHPNIIKLFEFDESPNFICLVLDYAEGGDLWTLLKKYKKLHKKPLPEEAAAKIIKKLLKALYFVHSRNSIHRDIKPGNILLAKKGDPNSVVLADFGLCKIFEDPYTYTTREKAGTLYYLAPEQLKQDYYGKSVDIFAVAILAYILLVGKHPFQTEKGADKKGVDLSEMKSAKWKIPIEVSEMAKNFILKLGTEKPYDRLSSAEALTHPFVTRDKTHPIPMTLSERTLAMVAGFNLKKAFSAIIFYKYCQNEFMKLTEEEKKRREADRLSAQDKLSNIPSVVVSLNKGTRDFFFDAELSGIKSQYSLARSRTKRVRLHENAYSNSTKGISDFEAGKEKKIETLSQQNKNPDSRTNSSKSKFSDFSAANSAKNLLTSKSRKPVMLSHKKELERHTHQPTPGFMKPPVPKQRGSLISPANSSMRSRPKFISPNEIKKRKLRIGKRSESEKKMVIMNAPKEPHQLNHQDHEIEAPDRDFEMHIDEAESHEPKRVKPKQFRIKQGNQLASSTMGRLHGSMKTGLIFNRLKQ